MYSSACCDRHWASGLLNKMRQQEFLGYKEELCQTKQTFTGRLVTATIWRSSKVSDLILSLFLTFVTPTWLKCLYAIVSGVLSSDNCMVCFRHKAFLKSDTAAGLTRSSYLSRCITHLLWVFLYFEFGALQFHRMLSRWVASGTPAPERLTSHVISYMDLLCVQ